MEHFYQNKGVVVNSGFDRFAFNAKLKNILTDRLTLSSINTSHFLKNMDLLEEVDYKITGVFS